MSILCLQVPLLLVPLLLASAAICQAPCLSANDAGLSVPPFVYLHTPGMPGVHAWQISSPTPLVARSLQIATGLQSGAGFGDFLQLDLYDDAAGLPGVRLAGGTWRFEPSVGWQGTNLDAPLAMTANKLYWVVFHEPGWAVPPVDPGGFTTFPEAQLSAGVWQGGGVGALKFRLFCDLLQQPGLEPFGPSCADSGGREGTLFTNRAPTVGNTQFSLEGTGLPPGATVVAVLGDIAGFPSLPMPGTASCFLNTDWLVSVAGVTGTGTVQSGCVGCAAAEVSGHATFALPIPNHAALAGFFFAAQLVTFDAGSTTALPLVGTNALRVTIQ
ncbi:MAG: hypothetical protein R3F29_01280 [Planctomycetota bacterium]